MENERFFKLFTNESTPVGLDEDLKDFLQNHHLAYYAMAMNIIDITNQDNQIKQELLVMQLQFKKKLTELFKVTSALIAVGIDYRLIKGIGISHAYPVPSSRVMSDHDILVKPEDLEHALKVFESLGYQNPLHASTYKDITLVKDGFLPIELHHALLHSGREPYAVQFLNDIWCDSDEVIYGNMKFKVPNKDMHFKYIVLHMMKHFKAGGFGVRHLLDLKHFALGNKLDVFSYCDFFDSISYGAFYRTILAICIQKIGLDVAVPKGFTVDQRLINQVSNHIVESGTFGRGSQKISKIRTVKNFQDISGHTTKFGLYIAALFPKGAILKKGYPFLKRSPYLLPIAWVMRIIKLLFRSDIKLTDKLNHLQCDDDELNEMNLMMKSLGLKGIYEIDEEH